MSNYYEWTGFSEVYLEDSFVLGLENFDSVFRFDLDLVITEKHQLYSKPNYQEKYCYVRAYLCFTDVFKIDWVSDLVTVSSTYVGDNEEDFGNIDFLRQKRNQQYHMGGDWGEILIGSKVKPKIIYMEQE